MNLFGEPDYYVPCKGCGKRIIFAENEDGAMVPLDPSPPCYELQVQHEASNAGYSSKLVAVRRETTYVSHYVTCPKADQFSKGGERG